MALNIGDMASLNEGETEFRRMVQEKIAADMRKQRERTERYRNSQYGRQTTCIVNNQKQAPPPPPLRTTDYDESYDSNTLEPKRKTREEIKIDELTTENQKLKNQYADLLQKANKLVAAYRELDEENKKLKTKKAKQEVVSKGFAVVGKGVQTTWDKIILWFNT